MKMQGWHKRNVFDNESILLNIAEYLLDSFGKVQKILVQT